MNSWRYVMIADIGASYVAKHQMEHRHSPDNKFSTTLRLIILRVYPSRVNYVRNHSGQEMLLNVTNMQFINKTLLSGQEGV